MKHNLASQIHKQDTSNLQSETTHNGMMLKIRTNPLPKIVYT